MIEGEILEVIETFYIEISTNVPRVEVGRSTATVNLVDNDGVYISLLEREVSVDEDAAAGRGPLAQIQMCVRMTGIIQTEVVVRLFTEAGTAQGTHLPLQLDQKCVCVKIAYSMSQKNVNTSTLPYPTLPYPTLPYLITTLKLPYLSHPLTLYYPTLPYPTLPYPDPYPTPT